MLGAARIGDWGLVRPSRKVDGVVLQAVAARDLSRAQAYAQKHGFRRAWGSYDALLSDPEIDAVYNPLPNALHCEWTLRAVAAGKHVLCEKPFASNADEARRMAEAARAHGRVVMEALHYRYHPLAARMDAAVAQLGAVERIECIMCVPIWSRGDIRWDFTLAGGATMDLGAYTVSLAGAIAQAAGERALPEVRSAQALLRSPQIDRAMKAELRWPSGLTARLHHSMWSSSLLTLTARVVGARGELRVSNPYAPHFWNKLRLTASGKTTVERVRSEPSYMFQLREFAARVRANAPSDCAQAIATMQVIDAIYDRAGLARRGTHVEAHV
jgi:predicted dehydrogenase